MAAAASFPLIRIHHHLNTTLPAAICYLVRRPCYTATASESPRPIRKPPSTTTTPTTTTYDDKTTAIKIKRYVQKDPKWENDPDYRKWKDKEADILLDIDPLTNLIKDILHSD
ncbi:hypothetical protein Tco_0539922, partial [Tanacetum coccineum]